MPDKNDNEESVSYITSYRELYEQLYDSNYKSDADNYDAAVSKETANKFKPLKAKIQFGKFSSISMFDSRCECIFITITLFKIFLKATLTTRWIISIDKNDLEPFSNEPIKVLGKLATSVTQNEWTCEDARLSVVDYGHKNIIGRVTFNSLGLAVVQQQLKKGNCVNNI